jgi:hypothetical protein
MPFNAPRRDNIPEGEAAFPTFAGAWKRRRPLLQCSEILRGELSGRTGSMPPIP